MHNSSIGDFSRGGEIIANRAALFAVNVKRLFISWLLVFVAGFGFTAYKSVDEFEASNYAKTKIVAPFLDLVGFGETEMQIRFSVKPKTQGGVRKKSKSVSQDEQMPPSVKEYPGTAGYFATSIESRVVIQQAEFKLGKAAVMGIKYAFAYTLLAVLFFMYTGWQKRQQKFVRGASIVSSGELASHILRNRSNFKIGGVPVSKEMLGTGFLFIGGMGSGKTQAICHMLDIARDMRPPKFFDFMFLEEKRRAMQAVVFDVSCEYTEQYYQDGDYILNIFDKRCVNWNIFNDIREDFQYHQIASIIITAEKGDQIWTHSARTVLADVMRIIHRRNKSKATFQQVQEILSSSDLESLRALLESTPSAALISPENARGSESIRMTIAASPVYRFLAYMKLDPAATQFSIYEFVQTRSSKWLFITARTDMRDVSTPVAQLAITLAIQAVMSRPIQHGQTDFLFVLDELPAAGKLEKLDLLQTEGRKFGTMVISGVQELSRLETVYGAVLTRTLVSGWQTALVLRTMEADSAKRMSEKLGKEDSLEINESTSFGVSENRDGMNMSQRRTERHIVLPSEIQALPALEGFLSLPGHPVARVKIPFKARAKIAEGLVSRTDLRIEQREEMPLLQPVLRGEEPDDVSGKPAGAPTVNDLEDMLSY